jgi:hypothetical protein
LFELREPFAGAAGERDDLLTFVAGKCFAEASGGFFPPAGSLEHMGKVGERVALA